MPSVTGFLPSTSGFHFSNTFQHVPDLKIDILGNQIGIGDAANGLCGGMVFAVRDYFEARTPIPPDTRAPTSGPLFDYLVKRLFDSFNLPKGPLIYMNLMDPALPDHETWMSNAGLAPRGRAWIMINSEWPKIKADIDSGHLSPMALIEVKTLDATQMGHNHQVLAYGYDLNGSDLTIHLYDPNSANSNSVTLKLSISDPQHTTDVTFSNQSPVWCFFRPDYQFSAPLSSGVTPAWQQIGEANNVVGMAAINNKLFAATGDNRLWARDPVLTNPHWQQIGEANNVAAMAALNNKLFAATHDNVLWARDPVLTSVNWQQIGEANNVVGMAAIDNKLFAATRDNLLWARDAVLTNPHWQQIGHANSVVAMTATGTKLIAATSDNILWTRDPVLSDVNWQQIGTADRIVGMAAVGPKLFAATRENVLWARDLS